MIVVNIFAFLISAFFFYGSIDGKRKAWAIAWLIIASSQGYIVCGWVLK